MPAPAPWAKTKQAIASRGVNSSAEIGCVASTWTRSFAIVRQSSWSLT
jgi:hypothetical protein